MPRHQIPNALTLLRLVLAAGFFVVLNQYRFHAGLHGLLPIAALLFIVAAITDALDGYLARRWEVVSKFGRIMDPFCDKVLVLGAFVYLASWRFVEDARFFADEPFVMVSGVYPWMLIVILARELLVTGIRGVVESMGVSFAAGWSGKLKMILQSVVVPVVLMIVAALDMGFLQERAAMAVVIVRDVLVYLTVIATAVSVWPYITRAQAAMAEPPSDNPRMNADAHR